MNILFFSWKEINGQDFINGLIATNNTVTICPYNITDYVNDPTFIQNVEKYVSNNKFDAFFSYNFLPIISKLSFRLNKPYVCWIYDSPCLTVYSEMIYNPNNYIFHFDKSEVARLQSIGVKNIWHLPLAVDYERIQKIINDSTSIPSKLLYNKVTFMGSLYNDTKDYENAINILPEYEAAYLDGLVASQKIIGGLEIIDSLLPECYDKLFSKYFNFSNMGDEFTFRDVDLFRFIISTYLSSLDRLEMVQVLSQNIDFSLYSGSDCSYIKHVINRGYVDYFTEMPILFSNCPININMTIRSIKTGIPLRALDIMASGGFLLSNPQTELYDYFVENEDFVAFYSIDDLLQKTKYYLEYEDERKRIAQNGNRKTTTLFSYKNQISKMLQIVNGAL